MKVLVYGYYDDFANFFLNLRDCHKSIDPEAEYHYLTPNFSGYITWNDRNKSLFGKSSSGVVGSYNFEYIEAFNILSGTKSSRRTSLRKIAFIERLMDSYNPDVVIISGDARPNSRILQVVAQAKGARCLYFEQGPLGTTIFSRTGVTANHIPYSKHESVVRLDDISYNVRVHNRRRWQRYADAFQLFSSDPEVALNFNVVIKKLLSRMKSEEVSSVVSTKPKLLFALQVPDDINSLYYGPFAGAEQLIRYLGSIIISDIDIVIREHPMYRGSYDKELYSYIEDHANMTLDKPLTGVGVDWSQFIGFLTVNSLMTFEAIQAGVPVGVLGRSCYADMVTSCWSLRSLEQFIQDCKLQLFEPITPQKLSDYLTATFYRGHFRQPTEELLFELVNEVRGGM